MMAVEQRSDEYLRWRAKAQSFRMKRYVEQDWGRPVKPEKRQEWEDTAFEIFQKFGLPEDAE